MSSRAILAPVFILLLLAAPFSQAATITFSETSVTAVLNENVAIDLLMDFSGDATQGGAVDILFDPAVLSFDSFDFGSTTLTQDIWTVQFTPVLLGGKLQRLTFGNLLGLAGPGVIGTLTFQTINAGSSTLTLETAEPFLSISTGGVQTVNFGSANVTVKLSAVPVPVAAWLFGSGLIALVTMAKKRKAA